MPVGNKQCYQRQVQKTQEKHKQKLREMKCSIDNAPPKRHNHLHKNLKKEQLMVRRGSASPGSVAVGGGWFTLVLKFTPHPRNVKSLRREIDR